MKALWVSHIIPYPPKAGVLLRAFNLLKALAESHTVDLVAFVQEPMLRMLYSSVDAGLADCRQALGALCQEVILLPIPAQQQPLGRVRLGLRTLLTGHGYIADWLASSAATQAISGLAARGRYDVAHFDSISVARYRPLLPRTPATLGHHNVESHMLLRRGANSGNPVKRFYFTREGRRLQHYEQRMVPAFQQNLMCSQLDAERLREIVPGAPAVVVPNGVDCDYFRPAGVPGRPDSLIFVGTMNWYPNVSAVLYLLQEVWPELSRRRPGATLDIVGANAPQAIHDAAAGKPGVKIHGFVPEVRPMIESAAVYICPIRDGGGTKLKILDACAMGSCVLAHPIACEGIDVTPGVDVVFADTPQDFVAQAIRLFDDAEHRRALGRAARQLAEQRYSFRQIGRDFVGVMEAAAEAGVPSQQD